MGEERTIGRVVAVCVSDEKGVSKTPVDEILLEKGGVKGDAHFGSEREVSLLSFEAIVGVRERFGLDVGPGTFAENITVEGLKKEEVRVGMHIRVGGALLEVVAVGKGTCGGCSIEEKVGLCIGDTDTVFCRVVEGGRVGAGDSVSIVE